MRALPVLACAAALLAAIPASAQDTARAAATTAGPTAAAKASLEANGPHLEAADVTLPLVQVNGYPFVEGAIDGHRGKLLFDIGEDRAMSVDIHTVPVPNGVPTGTGHFGSGQSFQTERLPVVDSLTLFHTSAGDLSFHGMTNIHGSPGIPLEQHITPDFIGWLGIAFFGDDHLLVLDYKASTVRLVRNDATGEAMKRLTAGHTVLQTIALGNPAHPNLKTFSATAGGVEFEGTFDTGAHDAIWVSPSQEAALKAAGALTVDAKDPEMGVLSGLTVAGRPAPSRTVQISRRTASFAELLPRQDLPLLTLAYEFLSQQPTIWDYRRNTVTLLEP